MSWKHLILFLWSCDRSHASVQSDITFIWTEDRENVYLSLRRQNKIGCHVFAIISCRAGKTEVSCKVKQYWALPSLEHHKLKTNKQNKKQVPWLTAATFQTFTKISDFKCVDISSTFFNAAPSLHNISKGRRQNIENIPYNTVAVYSWNEWFCFF